jgi:RNAse (barnase) inhibitor barstar
MAWQIAIVLDEVHKALIREMPVWALETPSRREQEQEIQDSVAGFWSPEPAFTLFEAGGAIGPLAILANVVGTVLEHRPRATCLDLIGIAASPELTEIMLSVDFEPAGQSEDGLLFIKPTSKVPDVPELVMDARGWKTRDDLFDSFFRVVGAPEWHGRNLYALDDSIVGGGINRVEVPYALVITNLDDAGAEVFVMVQEFVGFVRETAARGCPISIGIRG